MQETFNFIFIISVIAIALILLKRRTIKNWNMRRIDKCTGEEFERYLCLKFIQQGYRVRHTGKSGDFGADIVLYQDNPKKKIIVQAKRYRNSVNQDAIREVFAAKNHYKADECWVVTNSTFTKAAEVLAKDNNVKLFDRRYIYRLLSGDSIKETNTSKIYNAHNKEANGGSLQNENEIMHETFIQLKFSIWSEEPLTSTELTEDIIDYLYNKGYRVSTK